MIISASRRTDIPAFFAKWFEKRLKEKEVYTQNPYNRNQIKKVSLKKEDVNAFVFWTKNPKPFINTLKEIEKEAYPNYTLFTLNAYNNILEKNLPPLKERIDTFKRIVDILGVGKVIWRYDPIILSNINEKEFHEEAFYKISNALKGYNERVIISFLTEYDKLTKRFMKVKEKNKMLIKNTRKGSGKVEALNLVKSIKEYSAECEMEIFSCAESLPLEELGVKKSKCIDCDLLNNLYKTNINYKKDKKQRERCLCSESIDIGVYNSCPNLCTYCYANGNEKSVLGNYKEHDENSPLLIGKTNVQIMEENTLPF